MSSVSASDRAQHTDELRSNREEYNNKTAEEAKRHKREIRNLSEQHDKEVEQLKEAYENQIGELRNKSNFQLSERDKDNQAQIERLRGMYLEQFRKKAQEHEEMKRSLEESFTGQITKQKTINEQQKEVLKTNFDDSLAERDRAFNEYSTNSQKKMKDTIEERADKLREKHDHELRTVVKDRDEHLGKMSLDIEETKSAYENRLKDDGRSHRAQVNRIEDNWQTAYKNKNIEMNAVLQSKDAALQAESARARAKYDEALEHKLKSLDRARDTLKDQAMNRIDNEVSSVKNDMARVQSLRVGEMISNNRMRDLDKKNITDQYEKRMDIMEEEREGILKEANRSVQEHTEKILNRSDRLLQDVNRDTKMKISASDLRHKEDRSQLENLHKGEVEHLKTATDSRVDKIMNITTNNQIREQKMHDKNLDQLRGIYADTLASQREAQVEQLSAQYRRMDQRLKETEQKYEKKMEDTTQNYEAKIANQEEFYQGELKKSEATTVSKLAQREKAHNMELKTQEIKFDSKLAQLQEEHDKEIERLEKRHQEQMGNLSNRLNYYKKKA